MSNEFEKIVDCFLILTQEHELEQVVRGKLFCIWIALKKIIQTVLGQSKSPWCKSFPAVVIHGKDCYKIMKISNLALVEMGCRIGILN